MEGRRTKCPSCDSSVLIRGTRTRLGTPKAPSRQAHPSNRSGRPSRDRPEEETSARACRHRFQPPLVNRHGSSPRFCSSEARRRPAAKQLHLRPDPGGHRGAGPRTRRRSHCVIPPDGPGSCRGLRRAAAVITTGLVYPASNVPVFFRLAMMLSVLLSLALLGWLIDRDRHERPTTWPPWPAGGRPHSSCCSCWAASLSYFNGILALACEGKVKHDASIEFEPLDALASCGEWLACFAAGPAFLFGSALGYWLYCGDLTVVDWLILGELGFVGVGWWLLATLLTNVTGRFPRPARREQVLRTALGEWAEKRSRLRSWRLVQWSSAPHFFAAAYGIRPR